MDALKYKAGPGWSRYVGGMARYVDELRKANQRGLDDVLPPV
jgi:hypothetical protein